MRMGRRFAVWSVVAVILFTVALVLWVRQSGGADSGLLQRQVLSIGADLRAPGDENTLTVATSSSQLAQHIRYEVQQDLLAGKSKSQIVTALVSEYGPQVLAAPPARGFGIWVWALPVGFVVAGGVLVWMVLGKSTSLQPVNGWTGSGTRGSDGRSDSDADVEDRLRDYL